VSSHLTASAAGLGAATSSRQAVGRAPPLFEARPLDAVGQFQLAAGAGRLASSRPMGDQAPRRCWGRGASERGSSTRRTRRGQSGPRHERPSPSTLSGLSRTQALDAAQAGSSRSAMRRCAASKAKGRGSSCRGSERGSCRSATCNHHCTRVQGPRRCRGHVKLDAEWVLDALSSTVHASPHHDGSAVPSRREPTCSLAMRQPTCLTTGQLRRELPSRRKPSTARASLARLSAGAPQAQIKFDTGMTEAELGSSSSTPSTTSTLSSSRTSTQLSTTPTPPRQPCSAVRTAHDTRMLTPAHPGQPSSAVPSRRKQHPRRLAVP
jgi:hypothetical protein